MRYRLLHNNGHHYDAVATIKKEVYDLFRGKTDRLHGNKYWKTLVIVDNYALYNTIRDKSRPL